MADIPDERNENQQGGHCADNTHTALRKCLQVQDIPDKEQRAGDNAGHDVNLVKHHQVRPEAQDQVDNGGHDGCATCHGER